MRRGPWHQLGHNSQKLVLEHIGGGIGEGVVLSPRNLVADKSVYYARLYHEVGAAVLIDQQFYNPKFTNPNLESYDINQYRANVSALNQISDIDLSKLTANLRQIHVDVRADGVIAPGVVYESGSDQRIELNAKLFNAAKSVGDSLGIPTYATVVLGKSLINNSHALDKLLSSVTGLNSDGWYYASEFGPERIPSNPEEIVQLCSAGLTLSCTGKPVMHAYAGPTSLLSLGFGATAVGIGHSQTLWKFNIDNWDNNAQTGGNGKSPARFWSNALWGTIICPDEIIQIPQKDLVQAILTHSPYCIPVINDNTYPWPKWDSYKHVVYVMGAIINEMAATRSPKANMETAISVLLKATELHTRINKLMTLKDYSASYQSQWVKACRTILQKRANDYDYFDLFM